MAQILDMPLNIALPPLSYTKESVYSKYTFTIILFIGNIPLGIKYTLHDILNIMHHIYLLGQILIAKHFGKWSINHNPCFLLNSVFSGNCIAFTLVD